MCVGMSRVGLWGDLQRAHAEVVLVANSLGFKMYPPAMSKDDGDRYVVKPMR